LLFVSDWLWIFIRAIHPAYIGSVVISNHEGQISITISLSEHACQSKSKEHSHNSELYKEPLGLASTSSPASIINQKVLPSSNTNPKSNSKHAFNLRSSHPLPPRHHQRLLRQRSRPSELLQRHRLQRLPWSRMHQPGHHHRRALWKPVCHRGLRTIRFSWYVTSTTFPASCCVSTY